MKNDEIKEILEILKKCYDLKDENFDNYISLYQLGLLLDYITNLQQENSNLKFSNQALNNELGLKLYELDHLDEKRNELKKDELKEYVKLQQENERLKEIKPCMINFQECYVVKDYKSRCEKASEYNNQIIKDTKDFYRPTTDIIYSGDSLIDIATNNINILQNGSDDE